LRSLLDRLAPSLHHCLLELLDSEKS
jgi:hypothetical protein